MAAPFIFERQQPFKKKRNDWLIKHSYNLHSQCGEDGILHKIFSILPFANPEPFSTSVSTPSPCRYLVEFGAWDGKHLSNSFALLHQLSPPGKPEEEKKNTNICEKQAVDKKGAFDRLQYPSVPWGGVLIEADPCRVAEMQALYHFRCHQTSLDLDLSKTEVEEKRKEPGDWPFLACVQGLVSPHAGSASLDAILDRTALPRLIDLLCIDIDGNDYHVWESVQKYQALCVVIEFNPTIPNHIHFVQAKSLDTMQGSSLAAIVALGARLGYQLVCTTTFNAFFVLDRLYPLFDIADNSLEYMHDVPMASDLFQLYDGTLMLAGCKKLIWHKIPIDMDQFQPLRTICRSFPHAPPSLSVPLPVQVKRPEPSNNQTEKKKPVNNSKLSAIEKQRREERGVLLAKNHEQNLLIASQQNELRELREQLAEKETLIRELQEASKPPGNLKTMFC